MSSIQSLGVGSSNLFEYFSSIGQTGTSANCSAASDSASGATALTSGSSAQAANSSSSGGSSNFAAILQQIESALQSVLKELSASSSETSSTDSGSSSTTTGDSSSTSTMRKFRQFVELDRLHFVDEQHFVAATVSADHRCDRQRAAAKRHHAARSTGRGTAGYRPSAVCSHGRSGIRVRQLFDAR